MNKKRKLLGAILFFGPIVGGLAGLLITLGLRDTLGILLTILGAGVVAVMLVVGGDMLFGHGR